MTGSAERPVALIYHALVVGNGPDDYAALGARLASHGFIVASLPHAISIAEALTQIDAEFGAAAGDDVLLIGHSMGGELMVLRRSEVAGAGKDLRGLAVLAPRVRAELDAEYRLDGVPAFLGLHWAKDPDPATFGAETSPGRRSVHRIYDLAGRRQFPDPVGLDLRKYFTFFNFTVVDGVQVANQHLAQNEPGILAYVTAFARRHVYDDLDQETYLKRLLPIPGLSADQRPIFQNVAAPQQIALANFEEAPADAPAAFDDVLIEDDLRPTVFPAIVPAVSDPFSPYLLGVLRVSDRQMVGGGDEEDRVHVRLKGSIPIRQSRFLVLNIGQEYDPSFAPSGAPLDFQVELVTDVGSSSVQVVEYGLLPFPVVMNPLVLNQTGAIVDATKNVLQTYVIPLDDFDLDGMTALERVVFDFGPRAGEQRRFFVLDDISLIE